MEDKLDEYRKALEERAKLAEANDALKKELETALARLKKSEDEKLVLQKKVALAVTWGDQKQGDVNMGLAEMYVVRVHVDRAEGFHIAEEKGTIDRYCGIRVGDQQLATQGVHDTSSPVRCLLSWNMLRTTQFGLQVWDERFKIVCEKKPDEIM